MLMPSPMAASPRVRASSPRALARHEHPLRPEHEDAKPNQDRDRDVVGGLSHDGPGDGPQHDAHHRHPHFERRKQGRNPEPIAPRQAAHA